MTNSDKKDEEAPDYANIFGASAPDRDSIEEDDEEIPFENAVKNIKQDNQIKSARYTSRNIELTDLDIS